jgi:hypothetical protein
MNIYNVGIRGGLKKISKPTFDEESVILIDDDSTIYIWFGKKIFEKRKNLSIIKANLLNKNKEKVANIQIIHQNQEYGAFLDIFNLLCHENAKDIEIKRRPELHIEYDTTLEFLEAGLNPDLEAEITIASHSISKENKSYEELCRILAQLQLSLIKGNLKPSKKEIELKASEIFSSSSTYEELCWLIAQLNVLKEKNELK